MLRLQKKCQNTMPASDTLLNDHIISYNNETLKILGCPHYQLKAKVLAPCCKAWVSCRFCHDEKSNHNMDRHAVEQMKCMLCMETQPISQKCRACAQVLGNYYCAKCKLLDDDRCKQIFHCDQCGICLSGCKGSYYHCDTCNACVATSARYKHGCKEKRLHCDCPICGEQFFDSPHNIVQAECLHLMHEPCLEKHIQYSYKCPVCFSSLCDTKPIFSAIDNYMNISCMPIEYKNMQARVFCNDCHQRSVTKFHFIYHKCLQCDSYNTSLLSTIRNSNE
ncbi:zinc-ribbon-domain-containing protein [Coemansia spiralis]|nr:zinc-ribbon-domain-containing protein [Coemansia spiralis]